MTALARLFAIVPWYYKAGVAFCLILLTVNECQARDRAIARSALWQVSFDSTIAAKKLTEAELKAAKDTARILVAQATRKEADFHAKLRELALRKDKVVVIHDSVAGQPVAPPDTVAQTDLPIVKACTQALDLKAQALSSCQLTNILLQQQHDEDSIALRLALRKPKISSRARDITTGAVIGAALLAVVLHFAR